MVKKSGSGSGMNDPDHISECLETILLGIKILKFFFADPGFRMETIRIWDKYPGCNTDGNYSTRNGEDTDVLAVSFLLSISLLQDPSPDPYSK